MRKILVYKKAHVPICDLLLENECLHVKGGMRMKGAVSEGQVEKLITQMNQLHLD